MTCKVPPTIPIFPLICGQNTVQDHVSEAERELINALHELELMGALQPSNRMSIKSLLNPPEESSTMDETTDLDIFHAVMETRNGQGSESDSRGVRGDAW